MASLGAAAFHAWASWLVWVVAAAADGIVEREQGANGPPTLAAAWSADFTMSRRGPVRSANGTYHYDKKGQRARVIFDLVFDYAGPSDEPMRYDVLAANTSGFNDNATVGIGQDAVCRPFHRSVFIDLFDGLTNGYSSGWRIINGEPCQVWIFNSTVEAIQSSVCIARDGVPRQLNSSFDPIFGIVQHAFSGSTDLTFFGVRIGFPPQGTFDLSQACKERYPAQPCHSGRVAPLDVYRIHSPGEPIDVRDRNVADALGDIAFMCEEGAAAKFGHSLVTHWSLWANTSWDQYSYCFYMTGHNVCMGSRSRIGRESAWGLGVGHLQGQCSENADVGSWYSVPGHGECSPGESIGSNGCTWSAARAVRTVKASCILEDRGLLAACATEREKGARPWVRSAAIFEAALASADVSLGGCPDAATTPPMLSAVFV
mmetsp:Transcript_51502/g.130129  ORF Transcript_51502/g.130129 Transcript_51502/m.130129 type:complete len:429 (-) Transcript_51502:680-1966(-)|eukprot:CAMPEP_0115384516 /NCGR_PEP_ID=MMETSP0271-20121206/7148_1 /TAXON_ID=71861 /ORGANISM="Scrippsiella trochoidea, Strain CCMP3099" /LENGTH=428 /DNA_ID=CAMNT_0002807873 /DNA_START=52 /DNA_END=1338 /DNA_ORIENTATION=-